MNKPMNESILNRIHISNTTILFSEFIDIIGFPSNIRTISTNDNFAPFSYEEANFIEKFMIDSVRPHIVIYKEGSKSTIVKGLKYFNALRNFYNGNLKLQGRWFEETKDKYISQLSFYMKRKFHNSRILLTEVTSSNDESLLEIQELFS